MANQGQNEKFSGQVAAHDAVLLDLMTWAASTDTHGIRGERLAAVLAGTSATRFESNELVRLTRNRLVGLAALAVALLAIGAAATVRFWAPPKLSLPHKVIRPPQPSDLFTDHSPHDVPCPTVPEQAAASEPIETSVCRVVQRPDEFACKRIRFRATYFTDCMHGSVLIDEGCQRGIVPYGSTGPAADAFFEGACAGRPIDFGAKRRATFTGRFRLRSEPPFTVFVLEVESVKKIRITATRSPEAKLPTD